MNIQYECHGMSNVVKEDFLRNVSFSYSNHEFLSKNIFWKNSCCSLINLGIMIIQRNIYRINK